MLKLSKVVPIVIGAGLVALAMRDTATTVQTNALADSQIEAYMLEANAVRYGPSGKISHHFSAERWQHYPNDVTTHMTSPQITIYRDNGNTLNVFAARGHMDVNDFNHLKNVHLEENVVLTQSHALESTSWVMRTEVLDFDTKTMIARTDADVTINGPGADIKAKGMIGDLKHETIKLNSAVDSQYAPSSRMGSKS